MRAREARHDGCNVALIMNAIQKLVCGFGMASVVLVGCASSTDSPDGKTPPPPVVSQGVTTKDVECTTTYSDVVPAYIDYASVHCEGWTGKVFCEYDSLSSVYGPGWGTCQCYNTVCTEKPDMEVKRGRACRAWWCN